MNTPTLPLRAVWHHQAKGKPINENYLMVVLHGRGDSPEGYADFPQMLEIPNLNYVMFQAPDDYYGGYRWYAMPPNQLPGIERSRRLLQESFEILFQNGFSPEKTFLFGFSQGCLMTLEFGSRFSRVLGAYVGVSGYVYDEAKLLEEVNPEVKEARWLVTHGTQDDVLPIQKTRAQIEWLQKNHFPIEYREYRKTHDIDMKLEVPYLREWLLKIMKC